jgi:hypothetical protein
MGNFVYLFFESMFYIAASVRGPLSVNGSQYLLVSRRFVSDIFLGTKAKSFFLKLSDTFNVFQFAVLVCRGTFVCTVESESFCCSVFFALIIY